MAKAKVANAVAFNIRVSLESAVQNPSGGVNYYRVPDVEIVLPNNDPGLVAGKLKDLGVGTAEIKAATAAMNAAIKRHK